MAIVGFSFTKMLAERKKPIKGKITINNTVTLVDVEENELPLEAKGKSLKLMFGFSTKYEPEAGIIELSGEVIYLDEEKKIKEAFKQWKANKTLPNATTEEILNNVLAKCHIQAVIISRDISLPPPVAIPRIGIAAAPETTLVDSKKKG
ncbi:MAG: hypothetical protein AABX70_02055 [Nanoarchaeota archaeon]